MLIGLMVPVVTYLASQATAAYYFSRQEHLRGKHTLEIEPDGLKYRSPISEGTISWDGVLDVAEDKNSIYVFIGRGVAVTVPKRYFLSNEEAKHFLNTARAYKELPSLGYMKPSRKSYDTPVR